MHDHRETHSPDHGPGAGASEHGPGAGASDAEAPNLDPSPETSDRDTLHPDAPRRDAVAVSTGKDDIQFGDEATLGTSRSSGTDWLGEPATLPGGPRLGRILAEIDTTSLSARDLVAVIQGWERLKAYAAAKQFEAMSRLVEDDVYQRCTADRACSPARSGGDGFKHTHRAVDPCGDELSLALGWSPGRAKRQLVTAIDLTNELPATLAALKAGRLDSDKATLIAERTSDLSPSSRHGVEAAVLPKASDQTRVQLDYALRRTVIAADPEGAERRRALAHQGRRVSPPVPASSGAADGMAYMSLCGPAEDVTALYTAIDAAARHSRAHNRDSHSEPGTHTDSDSDSGCVGDSRGRDRRTLEQLRFDILTGLGWSALATGHFGCCNVTCRPASRGRATGAADGAAAKATTTQPSSTTRYHHTEATDAATSVGAVPAPALGRRHGRAATVNVTVAASTLFGSDDQPGWLDGFGPVTAHAARRIATEGPWRRLLTDPASGEVIDYGRTTYNPPLRLTDYVIARDRTCRFPTCNHPARHSDIDHKHPFALGGHTSATNTWTLHDAHHTAKTLHDFTVRTTATGTWWCTPAGYQHPVEPEPVGPITTFTREPLVELPRPNPHLPWQPHTENRPEQGALQPDPTGHAHENQLDQGPPSHHEPPPF